MGLRAYMDESIAKPPGLSATNCECSSILGFKNLCGQHRWASTLCDICGQGFPLCKGFDGFCVQITRFVASLID